MSAAELPAEVEPEAKPKRNKDWVQDYQVWLVRLVYDLAKTGVFKGRACAQAVLTYYRFNTAIYNSEPRDFRRGYVMPGCTFPAAVAKATSFTPKSVREANIWLHQQRLINIEDYGASIYTGATDEAERLKLLAEEGPCEAPELKAGPRPRKAKTKPHADVIEPEVRSIETSGSITEEPIRTSGSTYSSDLHSYNSDLDIAESAAPTSTSSTDFFEEEREEAAARPVVAEVGAEAEGLPSAHDQAMAYITSAGKDRPVVPDDGQHWWVDHRRSTYRPAAGRGRPKADEILVDDMTEAMLLEEYPDLAGSWPDPVGLDDVTYDTQSERAGASEDYDNVFWYGIGKDGKPYFARASSRKTCKSDQGQTGLSPAEASKFFRLKKADPHAWVEYKRELFRRATTGQDSGDLTEGAPRSGRIMAADYEAHDKLMQLAGELARCGTWNAAGVTKLLRECLKRQDSTDVVISKLQQHLSMAA